MPTFIELFAFNVPEYATDNKSSKIIPCPHCKNFHVVAKETNCIKLPCSRHYAELIDIGPARRKLLGAFLSGKPIPDNSELWHLQPIELWDEVYPLTEEDAAKLEVGEVK
jgi:hypothetical protein